MTWRERLSKRRGKVVVLRGPVMGPKDGRSQSSARDWTEPATRIANEPIASVPYDVENDDAPSDELWICPLCDARSTLWLGQPPHRCWNCGQVPKEDR